MSDTIDKTQESPKSEKSPIAKITLDTNIKDMIRFDEQGYKLFFESTPGRFKELAEEDVRKLSAQNKDSYLFAFMDHQKAQKAQPSEGLQVQPERAMATERLGFEYTPEFLAKYHPCLKRPDELRRAKMEGYTEVFASDGVKGFGVEECKGSITVGAGGFTELHLMKIDREIYERRQTEIRERSKRTAKNAVAAGVSAIDRVGGRGSAFIPKERDNHEYHDLGGQDNGKQG